MAACTGPVKLPLVLLCSVGTWLSVHMLPICKPEPCEVQQILEELSSRSVQLLESYLKKEIGLPRNQSWLKQNYPVPCFFPGQQAAYNISVAQAYLQKTKLPVSQILQQLDKLRGQEVGAVSVPAPTDSSTTFVSKTFILTVLEQFSACVKNTHHDFKKSLEAEGKTCSESSDLPELEGLGFGCLSHARN